MPADAKGWENAALLQSLVAEFLGAMFLVMTVILSGGDPINQYIGIGFVLMVLVFAFGHISGAHFNPAVSATFAMIGKLHWMRFVLYVMAQVLGGLSGGLVAYACAGADDVIPFTPLPSLPNPAVSALFAEIFYTMALCLVVACVATAHADDPNSHYAIAIGFVLLSAVSSIGNVSGAVLNPAVGSAVDFLALSRVNDDDDVSQKWRPTDTWVYWVGPFLGAAIASGIYLILTYSRSSEAEHARDAEAGGEDTSGRLSCVLPLRVVVFEFIGTFFLTLTAGLGSEPLAVGAILSAFIFASAGFCGGDFNPAVTLGAMLRYNVSVAEAWKTALIAVAQTAAGIVAGFVAFAIKDDVSWPHPDGPQSTWGAFIYEFMWTALLVTVVLNTTTPIHPASPSAGDLYKARASTHGLAIGMTVAVGAIGASKHGSGSGGIFNPAVGTGLSLASLAGEHHNAQAIWIYWLAPILGAIAAAGAFQILHTVHDGSEVAPTATEGGGAIAEAFLAGTAEETSVEGSLTAGEPSKEGSGAAAAAASAI